MKDMVDDIKTHIPYYILGNQLTICGCTVGKRMLSKQDVDREANRAQLIVTVSSIPLGEAGQYLS